MRQWDLTHVSKFSRPAERDAPWRCFVAGDNLTGQTMVGPLVGHDFEGPESLYLSTALGRRTRIDLGQCERLLMFAG